MEALEGLPPDIVVELAKGDVVYSQDEPAEDLFLVQEGEVELVRECPEGGRIVHRYSPGAFFGDDGPLGGEARRATARAARASRVLRIDAPSLHEILRLNPEVAIRMMRRFSKRVAELENDVASKTQTEQGDAATGAPSPPPPPPTPSGTDSSSEPTAPERPVPPEVAAAREKPAEPSTGKELLLVHPESEKTWTLAQEGELSVGRVDPATGEAPDVDLAEVDQQHTSSRRHARLLWRDGAHWVVEDKATANGTFLDGERLQTGVERRVETGSELRFGLVTLRYEAR